MRMRKRRILPATCPRTVWPLSSSTRNMALGSASTTSPSNSTFSSLDTARSYARSARAGASVVACRRRLGLGRLLRRRLVQVGVIAAVALRLALRLAVAVAVAVVLARPGGRRAGAGLRRRRLSAVGVLAARRDRRVLPGR